MNMSRFYRELHDRELLAQAENTLGELQRRSLVDVIIPLVDAGEEERASGITFPRRFSSISVQQGRLVVNVEKDFFSKT